MKSFRHIGNMINVTLGGTKLSDDVIIVEGGVVILSGGGASGDVVPALAEGVVEKAKNTSQAWTAGDRVFWDSGNSEFTKTEAANTLAGVAYEDAGSADATGKIKLLPSALGQAANVATVATADGSDAATTQALANQLKTSLNALLVALKAAGLQKNA